MCENRECGVLTDAEIEKARRHYRHAVEKHPRFADRVSAVRSHGVAETRGDKANAVEECYDAIAVLLRMVDVPEGRQTLGKPEEMKTEAAS